MKVRILTLLDTSSDVDIMASACLLTLLLPIAVVSHVLELPPRVLFKVGDRTELTCSMLSCPEKVKFVWTTLKDKPTFASVQTKEKESVLVFDIVAKNHENTLLCTATCGKETKQAKTEIKVYSFPNNPVLSGYDHLIMGKENVLHCDISNAFPSEFLEVQWIYGDNVVQTSDGEPDKDSILIPYTFTPSREDDDKSITCKTTLHVDGVPSDEKTKETSKNMKVLSQPYEVKISGMAAVSLGSNLTLTCEAQGSPQLAFTWSALKPDGKSVEIGNHQDLLIHNIFLSDAGTYQCEVRNDLGSQTATVSVVVQAPPMDTIIVASPQSNLKEGDSVTISCASHGVPVTNVVLSRRVNDSDIEPLISSEGSEISLYLTSAKLANSGLIICEAFNEFGSQRRMLNLTVEAHSLEVELLPNGPVVSERGSSLVLSCQASGCPHPEFSWNIPIEKELKNNGSLSTVFLSGVELEDEGTYTCEVTCGSIIVSKQLEVRVFAFPTNPIIKSPGPSLVGDMMKLTCTVHDVFPVNHFQILWMDGERELQREESWSFSSGTTNLTSVYSFDVDVKDQDKLVVCKVLLGLRGLPIVKMASTKLSIHYAPRSTSIMASPTSELKEGESMSMSCLSDSFPVSRMVLSKVIDGFQTELMTSSGIETLFTLPSVSLDDAGIYICEGSNKYGSHNASLEITVKAPPRNTTVEIFPSTDVQEGQNITICCRSVSFPPPAVVLSKLDKIESDSPLDWKDFLIPTLCLGVATAMLGVMVHRWRARKKGFYDLTKGYV
ncbi:hypothetical protein DNTS_027945 [Danionella cerebrum]|uniref:Ig-like domain-containing protein n=1 Tax=Danionella cerebrum TaxID=2873325 RepID=A0A553QX71_9TELE|nr:hypothetical protein DNTS_027945 [Danionella translucida]